MSLLAYLFAFSLAIPSIPIGGISLLLEDIVMLLAVPFVAVRLLNLKRAGMLDSSYQKATILLFSFSLLFFLIGSLQSAVATGETKLPTELWQMIKNAVVLFVIASAISAMPMSGRIKFIGTLCVVVVFGLLVGLAQYAGVDFLSELYGRTDAQTELSQQIIGKRAVGVSGHAIAWGIYSAQAAFLFAISSKLLLMAGKPKYRYWLYIGIALSLSNIIFSGSRSVIFASFFVCALAIIAQIVRGRMRAGLKAIGAISMCGAIWLLFASIFTTQYEFLMFRFQVLSDTAGGARVDQVYEGLSLLRSPIDFILGISSAGQRLRGVSYGIEVEPVNLFVNYGFVGTSMVYVAVFFVAVESWRSSTRKLVHASSEWYDLLTLYSLLWVFSLVVSTGYFVLQELVTGSLLWIISGLTIAFMQDVKTRKRRNSAFYPVQGSRHRRSYSGSVKRS